MRRALLVSIALLAATAQVAQAEQKFAYVDLQRALLECDEGKSAKAKLKNEFDKKQKLLDEQQESLKKEKEELDRRAMAMSDEARRQKEGELQSKLMQVTGMWQGMQKELAESERGFTAGIFQKMEGLIAEIAEAQGITFVMDRNAGLVYAPPSLDLTNELVRRFNDKYPVKGGAPAATPAKKEAPAKPKAAGK